MAYTGLVGGRMEAWQGGIVVRDWVAGLGGEAARGRDWGVVRRGEVY